MPQAPFRVQAAGVCPTASCPSGGSGFFLDAAQCGQQHVMPTRCFLHASVLIMAEAPAQLPHPHHDARRPLSAQLDPRSVPVWHEATQALQRQAAVSADRLRLQAVRARFANPLAWQQEPRHELYPEQQAPRDAAVLIGLQPVAGAGELQVVLTHRTAQLPTHAGQIAFPGGKVDAHDPTPEAAALREAHEEVGLQPEGVEVLGRLFPYLTGTGYHVTPVVALLPPLARLHANPHEVAQIFAVPLAFLMNPANHRKHQWQPGPGHRREWFSIPYLDAATGTEHYIWGVTAGILRDLYRFFSA